jgi:hypothetical protein
MGLRNRIPPDITCFALQEMQLPASNGSAVEQRNRLLSEKYSIKKSVVFFIFLARGKRCKKII